MKDISEIEGYEDVVTWCRDFFSATDSIHADIGVSPLLYRSERNLLMSLVSYLFDYLPSEDLTTDALLTLLSMRRLSPMIMDGNRHWTFSSWNLRRARDTRPDLTAKSLSDYREISYLLTIPTLSRYPPRSSGATATSHLSANTSHHRIRTSPSDAGSPSNRSPEWTSRSSSQT